VLFYVLLCRSLYCLLCVVLCIVCVYMCTELLPPGGYPIAVKYIISYIISYHNRPRRPRGEVELLLYSFFNLGVRWGGWSTLRSGRFSSGNEIRYPLYRRLGGPQGRSGRVRKISPPTGIRSPDRPVRSQSLYRLSYRSPRNIQHLFYKRETGPAFIEIFWDVKVQRL
jgi:hypothetical protein